MRVLICGASMAGLTAAYWFARYGAEVTVVELSDGLRRGGAPIDVRGAALDTARRMGILGRIRDQRVVTGVAGPVLGADGSQQATIDLSWFANESADDVEITRDRLNDILFAQVRDRVTWRFGLSPVGLEDRGASVLVAFSDRTRAEFDLVVGADGLHSTVRRLAFGPEADFVVHQGFYVGLLDLDPTRQWHQAMYGIPGLTVSIRDVGDGPLAYLICRGAEIDYDHHDLPAQRRIVRSILDVGDAWELPRLRAAFGDETTTGFYFDSMSQTKMERWSIGRVALIGDAASCATLLSGMGTTLAMTGAERLAEAVMGMGDLEAGLASFEERQRPLVDKAQQSIAEHGFMMVPASAEELTRRNEVLRELAAAHSPVGSAD